MPRFPVAFGRRKSTADNLDNGQIAQPSFRVLDRSQVDGGQNSFDGGARLAARSHTYGRPSVSSIAAEDNIFADLKNNRYVLSPFFLALGTHNHMIIICIMMRVEVPCSISPADGNPITLVPLCAGCFAV